MFERFTERARQVVVFAQEEARALKHNYIGTEHILLGLLRKDQGIAARVLESLEITVEDVRGQVARIVGQGDEIATGQIPFTPRAKKVLELSLREALALGHNYIGPEHILLGLVRENEGVASRILLDHGAGAENVRNQVMHELGIAPPPDYEDKMRRSAEPTRAEFPGVVFGASGYSRLPGRFFANGPGFELRRVDSLVLGWLLFGVALGIGVLIGWAIWG